MTQETTTTRQAGWDEAFGRPDESEIARLTARAIRAAMKQED